MPKSISVAGPAGKPGQVYYALHLNNTASPPEPTGKELLVKIHAAAMNHRDLFVRQNLYPGVTFAPVPLMSDGCGTVVSCGPEADKKAWQGKRVIMVPGIGWRDSPEGPEDEILGGNYVIMGGSKHYPKGTLAEYLVIDQDEVEPAPAHMSDAEAAALPLTGLTAWRAVGVEKLGKRNAGEGKDVLVTGIGGGVALNALQFLTKMGTRVWVTSGSQEKLNRAKELGAAGGVNYKEEGWQKKLLELVEGETGGKKTTLDGIVDGAGGDIIEKGFGLIKAGGVIVVYGMTLAPKMPFVMRAVMKNIDVKGTTMGSRKDFKEMVEFTSEKKIRPVVSRVVSGIDNLEAIDGLFEDMKKGSQFGKLVVEISKEGAESKL